MHRSFCSPTSALEHTDVLGDTREEIAAEKLAVARPGATVVLPDAEFAALVAGREVRIGDGADRRRGLPRAGCRPTHRGSAARPARDPRYRGAATGRTRPRRSTGCSSGCRSPAATSSSRRSCATRMRTGSSSGWHRPDRSSWLPGRRTTGRWARGSRCSGANLVPDRVRSSTTLTTRCCSRAPSGGASSSPVRCTCLPI